MSREILADPENDNSWRNRGALVDMCRRFLAVGIPESNIVPLEEFAPFIPLYKSDDMMNADPGTIRELAISYQQTFSIRHPIKVYAADLTDADDPNGVFVKRDQQYHKIIYSLLPLVRNINTINEVSTRLAKKLKAIDETKHPEERRKLQEALTDFNNMTTSLMNTASPDNPLDHRADMYAGEIGKYMRLVNPEDQQTAETSALAQQEQQELSRQRSNGEGEAQTPVDSSGNKKQSHASAMSGLIEW